MILTTAQTVYVYFVEGRTIFIGKRKTYAKRVETEHIRVESRTVTPRYSHMKIGVKSLGNAPNYELGMSYIRLTNGGKTLIHKVISSLRTSWAEAEFFFS
jgi:signal peptidase complex subunit 2